MADSNSRTGATVYFDDDILKWTAKVHAPPDAALQNAFDAPARHHMPEIQLGQTEARFTELLLRMVQAKTVVEVGTLAGYSALRMARGLPADGVVHTIEFDARHAAVAREVVAVDPRVVVHQGAGLDVLPTLEKFGPFDAVFIDADKGNYDRYGAWAAKHLRPGGLLIGDNAFLFGRLLGPSEEAQAMRRFHEDAALAFESVCVPTPDGLVVAVKR